MNMIIYRAYNKVNGKIYIGQTQRSLSLRIRLHLSSTKKGSKTKFHNAIRKHGIDSFKIDTIFKAESLEQLNQKEIEFIEFYNTYKKGYNMSLGGGGSNGYKHTQRIKNKMKGKIRSEETRKKLSEAHKGKASPNKGVPLSEEHKKKLSEAHKGKAPWNKGKPASEKIRKLLSELRKGVLHTDKSKQKISESLKGVVRSEETKQKMSLAQKGRPSPNKGVPRSEETKQKISESQKGEKHHFYGKTHSEEHRQKITEGNFKRWEITKLKLLINPETRLKLKNYNMESIEKELSKTPLYWGYLISKTPNPVYEYEKHYFENIESMFYLTIEQIRVFLAGSKFKDDLLKKNIITQSDIDLYEGLKKQTER